MTKQQLIHNKWAELGIILCANEYDLDGWIDVDELEKDQITDNLTYKEYIETEHDFKTMLCRPKSISGIEDNNKWVKIESKLNFPVERGQYFGLVNNRILIVGYNPEYQKWMISGHYYFSNYKDIGLTHYQPIEMPKPPIY